MTSGASSVGSGFVPFSGRRLNYAEWAVVLYIFLASFQNILALLIFDVYPPFSLFALVLKDIIAISAVAALSLLTVFKKKLDKIQVVFLLLMLLLFVRWLLGGGGDFTQFRLLITPVFLMLFGVMVGYRLRLERLVRPVLLIFTAVVFLGLLERFVLYTDNESFWALLNLKDFIKYRDPTMDGYFGLTGPGGETPASFYTSDFHGVVERFRPRRFITLSYFDALLFAHAYVLILIYYLIKWRLGRFVGGVLIMLLTLGKGGMLAAYFGGGLALARIQRSVSMSRLFFWGAILSTLAWVFVSYKLVQSIAMIKHVDGFFSGFRSLLDSPLGLGVGNGGNRAQRVLMNEYGRDSIEGMALGAESFLGAMLVQVGVLGVLIFSAMVWVLVKTYRSAQSSFELAISCAFAGTVLASFFSESAISYSGSGYIMVLAGALYCVQAKRERERVI